MEQVNYCIYCGNKLSPEDHYCDYCGHKILKPKGQPELIKGFESQNESANGEESVIRTENQRYEIRNIQPVDKNKTKKKRIVLIIVCTVIIASIVGLLWFLSPRNIVLSDPNLVVYETETQEIYYKTYPDNAILQKVFFRSSDNSIATVSDAGIIEPVSTGECVITAYTISGVKAKCEVEVRKLMQITLSETTIDIDEDDTYTLRYSVSKKNDAVAVVTFSSSNERVAKVMNNGIVYAVGQGSCVITASVQHGTEASCHIRVTRPSFSKKYSEYAGASWCQFSYDGYEMTFTNTFYDAYYDYFSDDIMNSGSMRMAAASKRVLVDMGFDEALFMDIIKTQKNTGIHTRQNDKYRVEWEVDFIGSLFITFSYSN